MTRESYDKYYCRQSKKHSNDMCWFCVIVILTIVIAALVSSCAADLIHGVRSYF